MNTSRAALIVCLLGGLLAACGESDQAVTAPERPDFNGGMFGAGHRTEADTTDQTTAVTATTTERGGSGFGSGH